MPLTRKGELLPPPPPLPWPRLEGIHHCYHLLHLRSTLAWHHNTVQGGVVVAEPAAESSTIHDVLHKIGGMRGIGSGGVQVPHMATMNAMAGNNGMMNDSISWGMMNGMGGGNGGFNPFQGMALHQQQPFMMARMQSGMMNEMMPPTMAGMQNGLMPNVMAGIHNVMMSPAMAGMQNGMMPNTMAGMQN